ncbi:MAG: sulfotransferase family protein [Pseudomonadota bacterium]
MKGVFIIGSGRSGTSFLQRVFDSHPDSLCLHEPDTLMRTAHPPFLPAAEDHARLSPAMADYVACLARMRALRAVQKRPNFAKSYRGPLAQAAREGVILALQGLERLIGRWLPVAAMPVPDWADTKMSVPVLKSVECLGRLPLIARACPDMRIVHILRHPCGVAASLAHGVAIGKMPAPRIYQDQLGLPLALEEGLNKAALDTMGPWETAAWQWTLLNDWALRQTAGCANVRVVLYDALCERLVDEAKDLFAWCGLSWPAQTENFLAHVLDQTRDVGGYHALVRNPRAAAHRWRAQLTAAEKATVMAIARRSPAGRLFDAFDKEWAAGRHPANAMPDPAKAAP